MSQEHGYGLILMRRPDEVVLIGSDIRVTLLSIEPGRIRIAIKAPKDVMVLREELAGRMAGDHD